MNELKEGEAGSSAPEDTVVGTAMGSQSPSSSLKPAQETIDGEHSFLIRKYIEACQQGDYVTVEEMVGSHVIDPAQDVDPSGVSGLHWAAINNRLKLVKFLVDNGAPIDREGGEISATPLHWACREGLVYIVDFLLKNGADPSKTDSQGFNALHLAVHSSNIMLVIYILVSCTDIPVDCPDPNGRTPLHWAAYQGDSLSVDSILKFQGNVRSVDCQGFTPLHWALIRGQKDCLFRLIEEGSDLHAQTNDHKTCFDVAADMNTTPLLKEALFKAGYQQDGTQLKRYFDPKWAKVITFFYPYLILGLLFEVIGKSHVLISLLSCLVILLFSQKALQKFLFPSYIRSTHPFLGSPLLSGVFSGSVFWAIVVWMTTLLPMTLYKAPLTNFIFLISASATVYFFTRAMFKNPGVIEPLSSPTDIKEGIDELLKTGNYDASHFCINTFNRKPLRSKYSQFSKRLIARFDHTCPWVYNDIGLRNHKLFLFFVLSLEIAIATCVILILEMFDQLEDDDLTCAFLDDELCAGLTYTPFTFAFGCWSAFQFMWLSFLVFSQLFQISKGVTTVELSALTRQKQDAGSNYSSVPLELSGTEANVSSARADKTCLTTFCLLTGIDQFVIAVKETLGFRHQGRSYRIDTDYGLRQNCVDFWFASGDDTLKLRNLWKTPVQGEANLNGVTVDYFKLFELPPSKPAYESV
ncbi:AKR1 [Cyberlindnera jadinii]|uniref:Palmitoyltransferase n=1 Tax=Cyberlindnera jadinii (strain ATCC 18201 / CBS 1600 / BCRC 20928 / JCM 3617 / NBRC 0987 / NRRL Y-1542) TaxID=983966 RepID=A0A0H5C607_CYBJN|nr:AKR1 [Cyberlindnera jadinii]